MRRSRSLSSTGVPPIPAPSPPPGHVSQCPMSPVLVKTSLFLLMVMIGTYIAMAPAIGAAQAPVVRRVRRAQAVGGAVDPEKPWNYEDVYTDMAQHAPGRPGPIPKRSIPRRDAREAFRETAPNIVVFYADDVGWGDTRAYGNPYQRAPYLDRLAAEGLVMMDYYASASVCSPSRAGILTGRLQSRTGVYPHFLEPWSANGLDRGEFTIPKMLRAAKRGYKSMLVGKWHLGAGSKGQFLPTRYGFDYFTGIVGGVNSDCFPEPMKCYMEHGNFDRETDIERKYPLLEGAARALATREEAPTMHWAHRDGRLTNFTFHSSEQKLRRGSYVNGALYLGEDIVQQPSNGMDLAMYLMHAAVNFVDSSAKANHPFFLYMNFFSMHKPVAASPLFYGTAHNGIWGDAFKEMDFTIGRVMKSLQDNMVHRNTFVLFTSDNGPTLDNSRFSGSAGPFKCGKGTTYEGGMRVPGILWMPDFVEPRVTNEITSQLDLFPTLVDMLGVAPREDIQIDGVSQYDLFFENGWGAREALFYWTHHDNSAGGWHGNLYAVRKGMWKLHFAAQGSPSHASERYHDPDCYAPYNDTPRLFHLGQDPGEKYPLPVTHTAYARVVANLEALARAHLESIGTPHRPLTHVRDNKAVPCCGRDKCEARSADVFKDCCLCQTSMREQNRRMRDFFENIAAM